MRSSQRWPILRGERRDGDEGGIRMAWRCRWLTVFWPFGLGGAQERLGSHSAVAFDAAYLVLPRLLMRVYGDGVEDGGNCGGVEILQGVEH